MPIKKQMQDFAESAGRAVAKIGAPVILACATGCEPQTPVTELTDAQDAYVHQLIGDNDRELPIYQDLMNRADSDAVFGDKKDDSAAGFMDSLITAQELLKQYDEGGQFYTFSTDNTDSTTREAAAYFYSAILEKDRYIALAVDDNGIFDGISASALLHEASHNVQHNHPEEIDDLLAESNAEGEDYVTSDFVDTVVEKKDFSYLVSLVGDVPDKALETARMSVDYFEDDVDTRENSWNESVEVIYQIMSTRPLAMDQVTWANELARQYKGHWDYLQDIGLSQEDIIDSLSKETTIYPEMHEQYMEKVNNYKQEHLAELGLEIKSEVNFEHGSRR